MPQVRANGIDIEYDSHGEGEPVLLIMGLGAQMVRWTPSFLGELTGRGFRAIRFDNRDVGLSHKFESAGPPDVPAIVKALSEGKKPPAAYVLDDMAADAVGVLDALGIDRAHIVGASMGGMIAQLVAADYPQRTLSLTSIMSTTGNRALPPASPEAMQALTDRGPDPTVDLEGYLAHSIKNARVIGSPGYPFIEAEQRERALANFQRNYYPVGFARQYAAVVASPDRREKLKTIKAPVMVVHGEADPLVPVTGGRDTHENIPGSELRIIPGMGHDVPTALNGAIADAIASVAARARVAA